MAFAGSIGMTLVILACALHKLWWPFFVVLFYLLAPLPSMIAKKHMQSSSSGSNSGLEISIFLTMGITLSAFALPIVLARAGAIVYPACYLTLSGNLVVFLTLVGYFLTFDADDSDYSMW